MSLETEIAALTSTGKALIDTFNGKRQASMRRWPLP